MKVVVLLGCSTAGKSALAARFQELYGDTCDILDTDSRVASDLEFGGDLGKAFLKFSSGDNTEAAQLYLELGERYLLLRLMELRNPLLIIAGPNLAMREPEWTQFVQTVNPTCIYLQLNKAQLYGGLKQRRQRQRRAYQHLGAGFGAWDKDLLTRYNVDTKTWDELSEEEALPFLDAHIQRVDPIYRAYTKPEHVYNATAAKHDPELLDSIAASIADCLNDSLDTEPTTVADMRPTALALGHSGAVNIRAHKQQFRRRMDMNRMSGQTMAAQLSS